MHYCLAKCNFKNDSIVKVNLKEFKKMLIFMYYILVQQL